MAWNQKWVRVWVVVLLTVGLISPVEAKKNPMAPDPMLITICKNIFFYIRYRVAKKKLADERHPEYLSDFDLLQERRYQGYLGKLNTKMDPELGTRIFYTATGKPDAKGEIPVVDPEAKALYIYIHGSGTNKASGINFSYKANALANMGYAALSFDLPFHKDGPGDVKFAEADHFMEWLNKFVTKYRQKGMPVYLAGHSYGPDVIAEYAKRYPHDINGIVMLSPADFTPELHDWFLKVTSMATDFWGDTKPNNLGARWAAMVSSGFNWKKGPTIESPDPTLANPNLRVRILSGENEEYFPGPVDEKGEPAKVPRDFDVRAAMSKLFKNANITVEPGVGHYIFTHKDSNGFDVVLRELLAVNGDNIANEKDLKKAFNQRKVSEIDVLALKYHVDPFFRRWFDSYEGGKDKIIGLIKEGDSKPARQLMSKWKTITQQREDALFENIRLTREWNPEFYLKHKEAIEKLGTKGNDNSTVADRYFELLESLPLEERLKRAKVSPEIYTVIEKERKVIPFDPEKRKERGPKKKDGEENLSAEGVATPAAPVTATPPAVVGGN